MSKHINTIHLNKIVGIEILCKNDKKAKDQTVVS